MNLEIKTPLKGSQKVVVHLFLICFSCLFSSILNAQLSTWDFPIKPGMEEWNRLKTEQERINAVQIPEDILNQLSSEELVELCMKFPLFGDFTAFNTFQYGFEIMAARFNIFDHLLSRKDAGKYLLKAYKDAGISGFKTLPYSNEFWSIKLYYIELVITQRNIIQELTSDEKIELLVEARRKFSEKITIESFATLPGLQTSVRIMASVLYIEKFPEFETSQRRQAAVQFINTGMIDDVPTIFEIVKMADNYINAKNNVR